ncbi:MAG: Lrp/AsnC family transcriptional regulator [Candidatus Lokiarchaeota archaeon]|nr:Lrp/AsnC family transcriptional regulator [Candidatus Lokiarchaeota archaeon]
MTSENGENPENEVFKSFGIDDDDVKILNIYQEEPEITHVEIAKRINKSQPAIGARVTKLQRKHLLATQKGINFKAVRDKMFLLIVDLQTKDPRLIVEGELLKCPFVINVFKRSGTRNMSVLLAATSMAKLEAIIDRHFRSNPAVLGVETSFVVDVLKDFVLPINWEFLRYEDVPCGQICCQQVRKRLHEAPAAGLVKE